MDLNWITNGISSAGFTWHGPSDAESHKAIVDPQQRLKQIWYLEKALESAQSVARVVLPQTNQFATCFLVGPNLILTNHHVFGTKEDAQPAVIEFNYRFLFNGGLAPVESYTCDTSIFVTDPVLDFTLVGLKELPKRPYLRLRHGQPAVEDSHIAIIQHPNGEKQQVSLRDHSLVHQDQSGIEYLTNTDYGSSGSPVFDDFWKVIALHSQRTQDPKSLGAAPIWYRNRGTKIEAILNNNEVNDLIP
jgi:endonuclease G